MQVFSGFNCHFGGNKYTCKWYLLCAKYTEIGFLSSASNGYLNKFVCRTEQIKLYTLIHSLCRWGLGVPASKQPLKQTGEYVIVTAMRQAESECDVFTHQRVGWHHGPIVFTLLICFYLSICKCNSFCNEIVLIVLHYEASPCLYFAYAYAESGILIARGLYIFHWWSFNYRMLVTVGVPILDMETVRFRSL